MNTSDWSVDLSSPANATWHPRGEDGNSPGEAWGLCSTGSAFDQRLACSDEDWHSGKVAPSDVERQTKGE